jgi:two-component system cell cycle sensor histidine kinase/response regulator CckA
VRTADEWWSSAYPDLEYREKVQNSWLIAIEKASATGTDIEMQEWALTIKDGTQRECEFYMVPLQDQSLIVMKDI